LTDFIQSTDSGLIRRFNRRGIVAALATGWLPLQSAWGADADDGSRIAALLRKGGCVALMRHAETDPGVGDPPEFKLDDCRTQRNLSAAGQQDARRIGAWFRQNKLKPRTVLSSAWCRCKDTADLAFAQHTVWPALNSVFNDRAQLPDQSDAVRKALAAVPGQQFEVWVTHQVNITALTGQGIGMGEVFILDGQGKLLARSSNLMKAVQR
jgi:phosphohistidine phosphatase SixA